MNDNRTPDQIELSKRLHTRSQKEFDKQQNALCFLVIGCIFLIVGIIFIFISVKKEYGVVVGLDPTSLSFYVMLIGLIGGVGLITFGLVKFILSYIKRKRIIMKINQLK